MVHCDQAMSRRVFKHLNARADLTVGKRPFVDSLLLPNITHTVKP